MFFQMHPAPCNDEDSAMTRILVQYYTEYRNTIITLWNSERAWSLSSTLERFALMLSSNLKVEHRTQDAQMSSPDLSCNVRNVVGGHAPLCAGSPESTQLLCFFLCL